MNDERTDSQELNIADSAGYSETRWPARTQRLVGELRLLCGNWLHEPLRRCLDHFDMRLHRQSEQTKSHLDQQHYLTTRQHLFIERKTFDERFVASINQSFDRLGLPATKSSEAVPQTLTLTLSLLDQSEHELAAALDQLVSRSEARGGSQLIELGYRLAVLIGTPPLESDALPVGPQAMARAFREASRTLGLPSVHELLLLQSLESSLIEGLTRLYELINAHLLADGILPRLRPFALPRAAARRERAKEEKPTRFAPSTAATAATDTRIPSAMPEERAETSGQPQAQRAGNPPVPDASITGEALQVALAALQEHLFQVDERTRFDLNRPHRLRQELLIQLNVGRPAQAARVSLSAAQDNTVELIVRLFGQIAQQLPQSSDVQSLLCDLQLPMLRVALMDHGFFEQHEHPARRVLGKIAEIARDWLDDSSGVIDRGLRIELSRLIERAGREPPSAALYLSLQHDLEQYLAELEQRTQLAERRQVDAMQGLERLEQARYRSAELLAQRFAKSSQQRLLVQLDHAWSDVLALTLLRHGEHSQIFGTRLAIADQLLGCLPIGNRSKLQDEVEAGLRQIGMQDDEVVSAARRMIDANQKDAAGHSSGVGDSGLHPGRQEKPAQEHAEIIRAIASAVGPAEVAPSAEVLRIHRHLRTLAMGTWFEFDDPSAGPRSRRRLVWYSALTGHSLFVTRNGQRAEELGELRLAHEIACGRAREMASDHEDVLDHAWRAVTREIPLSRIS
jgi:hypothetical protein